MGFGTLFFGYFLLLNITYFSITDLIASLIMAMGLYKLADVNASFKHGFYFSFALSLVGFAELVVQIISVFNPLINEANVLSYISMPRYVIIAILTLLILQGIAEVSEEVGLKLLRQRARYTMPFVILIYAALAVCALPELIYLIPAKAIVIIGVLAMLASMILVAVNLVTIYKSYAKICMPEDVDNDVPEKASKFGFVNKYREHTQEKQREYAEYKLEKFKKKISKKKKKK